MLCGGGHLYPGYDRLTVIVGTLHSFPEGDHNDAIINIIFHRDGHSEDWLIELFCNVYCPPV